jgi:hypothetical protein
MQSGVRTKECISYFCLKRDYHPSFSVACEVVKFNMMVGNTFIMQILFVQVPLPPPKNIQTWQQRGIYISFDIITTICAWNSRAECYNMEQYNV